MVVLHGVRFISNGLTMEEFHDFLTKKKIDVENFQKNDNQLYYKWLELFLEYGKASFDQQKKFLFNDIRRKYPFAASK